MRKSSPRSSTQMTRMRWMGTNKGESVRIRSICVICGLFKNVTSGSYHGVMFDIGGFVADDDDGFHVDEIIGYFCKCRQDYLRARSPGIFHECDRGACQVCAGSELSPPAQFAAGVHDFWGYTGQSQNQHVRPVPDAAQ